MLLLMRPAVTIDFKLNNYVDKQQWLVLVLVNSPLEAFPRVLT